MSTRHSSWILRRMPWRCRRRPLRVKHVLPRRDHHCSRPLNLLQPPQACRVPSNANTTTRPAVRQQVFSSIPLPSQPPRQTPSRRHQDFLARRVRPCTGLRQPCLNAHLLERYPPSSCQSMVRKHCSVDRVIHPNTNCRPIVSYRVSMSKPSIAPRMTSMIVDTS